MEQILLYMPNALLVFCRITSFFIVAPVFTARNVPATFKLGLSFFLTLMALAAVEDSPMAMDGMYILTILREILIGVLLGLIAYFFFVVAQMAGAFIDLQIGFAIANVIDPMTGMQSPMIGNFKYFLSILLFLSMDGHHLLIRAIIDSYRWVPLNNELFAQIYAGDVSNFVIQSFVTAFALALQMAAPIVASLFLVDVGLGLLARSAPQFNIFVIGIPVKILIGLIMLFFFIPGLWNLFAELFQTLFEHMEMLLELLAVPSG